MELVLIVLLCYNFLLHYRVVNTLGFDVRTFDPAGQDTIGGGCGQLWFVQDWMNKNPGLAKPSIGFGKDKVHPPKKWRWER